MEFNNTKHHTFLPLIALGAIYSMLFRALTDIAHRPQEVTAWRRAGACARSGVVDLPPLGDDRRVGVGGKASA
jgi:hypothetical protein